jgi:hypothetical protein
METNLLTILLTSGVVASIITSIINFVSIKIIQVVICKKKEIE